MTERRDIGLYDVPLSMPLLDFGMGTILAIFHICSIIFFLKSRFKHAREGCGSKRAYVF